MITFKETINENTRISESKKRKVYEGIAASKIYKNLNKKNISKTSSYEGLDMESIIDKGVMYYIYFDYEDAVMLVIENPNSKDVDDYANAQEAG